MENVKGRNGGTIKRSETGDKLPGAGRPKGSQNRKTLALKWLSVKTTVTNPVTNEKQKGTIEDQLMLSLINKGLKGDVVAIKEIFEMRYGKAVQPVEMDAKKIETGVVILLPDNGRGKIVPINDTTDI